MTKLTERVINKIKPFSPVIIYGMILAGVFLGVKGCNTHYNNKRVYNPYYERISTSKWFMGHTDFLRYSDGMQEIIDYSNAGYYGKTINYQDADGDNKIDRIIINSQFKVNTIQEILIRNRDYLSNKEDFDNADRLLKELSEENPGFNIKAR